MEESEAEATRPVRREPSRCSRVAPVATSARGGAAFRGGAFRVTAAFFLVVCFFFFCAYASGDSGRSSRTSALAARRVMDDFIKTENTSLLSRQSAISVLLRE